MNGFARSDVRRGTPWLLLGSTVALGCGGATEIVTPPPPPPSTFVMEFKPDPEDAGTGAALGWQDGVPDVDLTLQPVDSTRGGPRSFRGTPQGKATIADLPPGTYLATAARWLTASERGRLGGADDALGFVVRVRAEVAAGGRAVVTMPASRRRSLVMSEWSFNIGDDYHFGGFVELYNNADTTVYVDGMLLAEGFNIDYDYPISPCAENAPYTNDGEGVWTRFFQRFPGTGRDYPVLPGQAVVVATDAIDHRPLSRTGIDLRQANFEFSGFADADNPAVPNLHEIGLRVQPEGHGLVFPGNSSVTILARPGDPASFARAHFAQADYVRVPRALILDVLWRRSMWDVGLRPCPQLVHARFDREGSARGTNANEEAAFSVSRHPIAGTPGVGAVLQHSRSGDTDFTQTRRSPGVVP